MLSIKALFFSMNIIISNFRRNEGESLFQRRGFLDRQIRMEPLVVIDSAKKEAKMAKIIRNIYVYC